jgi:hypothetical protein
VIAFKFLSAGAVGPFTGFRWPTPAGGFPGAWVARSRPSEDEGIHACRPVDLPYWLDKELWVAELDGPVRVGAYQVVADRGRLLRPVDRWPEAARAFGEWCADRLRDDAAEAPTRPRRNASASPLLRGYVADAAVAAAAGDFAVAAYVAARAAGAIGGGSAFVAERVRQAAWLSRLGLDPSLAPI